MTVGTSDEPGRRYDIPAVDAVAVHALQHEMGLSRIVAHLVLERGMDTREKVADFLSPSIDRDATSPYSIPGMQDAVDSLQEAVRNGERIVIFGDFDADGVSATAVMMRGLRALGADVTPVIPNRFDEGYGLSEASIVRIVAEEPDCVVTVDNGISARVPVAGLVALGIRVIVTDHHEPSDLIPEDVVVCDPKLEPDCPSRNLAGVGVALKLISALGQRFGKPDLWRGLVDLATLGTVGDQMPLLGENRALVADGIRMMNEQPSPAITAFLACDNREKTITAEGLAFSLIPRINSAGRIEDPQAALDLLLADDYDEALVCMRRLEEINGVRREIERIFAADALAAAAEEYHGERALLLASEGWHEGVKGIVASRMVSHFNVPTILFSIKDGIAYGSGRSVGSVDLFKAVERCADLLIRFGGHEAAVGVTLDMARFEEFKRRLCGVLDELPAQQFIPTSTVDMEVALEELDTTLLEDFSLLAPFGHDNQVPVFYARGVLLTNRRKVGNPPVHFSCTVTDGACEMRAIYFHPADLERLYSCEQAVDLVFRTELNEFRGRRSVQLLVKDVIFFDEDDPTVDTGAPVVDTCGVEGVTDLVEELFEHSDECLDRADYAGILNVQSFYTKVAGVTFEGRQEILARLSAPLPLDIRREPDNVYDPCAVALFAGNRQIGYLNSALAQRIAPYLDGGGAYDALLTEVTGRQDGRTLGANILLCKHGEAQARVRQIEMVSANRQFWEQVPTEELADRIRGALIGDQKLHDAQIKALDLLAQEHNVLAIMATGRGKSLIFQMHAAVLALKSQRASVFVYPLRALVADQAFHLQALFDGFGIKVCVLTGETGTEERDIIFDGLGDGSVDCVLTTPEFLAIHAKRFADTGRIGFLVIDEAHHIGLARAGNRPAYGNLAQARHELGDPVCLAVTATASTDVAHLICEMLSIDEVVCDATVRDNLRIVDERGLADRDRRLIHLVADSEKTVVYVNSREQSIRLARLLRKTVVAKAASIAFYNAGLSRADRQRIEGAFRDGQLTVIISTSAFGEGVNISDIRDVVLYHMPYNSVEFNQMAGRAGRDGKKARIHLYFGAGDARINERLLTQNAPSREDMITLYRVIRTQSQDVDGDGWFQMTNELLSEACTRMDKHCHLGESGVSCGLSIFRELGLVDIAGHSVARRIRIPRNPVKVDLTSSIRYMEGLEEIDEFAAFKEWVLKAPADELLQRFNRPILPADGQE